jgi:Tol biopolymer transport system component
LAVFGGLFFCAYLALAYLCEIAFNWQQSAASVLVAGGLLTQVAGFQLFHHFLLVPAALVTLGSLVLALDGLRRGALKAGGMMPAAIVAATLALSAPFFSFVFREFRQPVQPVMHFERLAKGLDSMAEGLAWSPAVARPDMEEQKKVLMDLAPRVAYGSGKDQEHSAGAYDPTFGGAFVKSQAGPVEGLWWTPDARTLAFNVGAAKDQKAKLFVADFPDPLARRNQPLKAFPDPRLVSDDDPWPSLTGQCWSKDGRWLLFSAPRRGISRIWKVDMGKHVRVALTQGAPCLYPAWSPAGGRMAYVLKKPKAYVQYSEGLEHEKIFTLAWKNERSNVVGTEETVRKVKRLNKIDPNRMSQDPRDFLWTLVIADPAGKKVRELLHTDGAEIMPPVWSPKGDRVAFVVRYGDRSSVMTVGPDGSWPMRFFITPDDVPELAWSPDSKKLAFLVKGHGNPRHEVWTVNMDGLWLEPAYKAEGDLSHLGWCPNDDFLAVEETVRRWLVSPDLHTIMLVDLRDGKARQILPFKLEARDPVFSPNGSLLGFIGGQHRWLQGRRHAVWAARFE